MPETFGKIEIQRVKIISFFHCKVKCILGLWTARRELTPPLDPPHKWGWKLHTSAGQQTDRACWTFADRKFYFENRGDCLERIIIKKPKIPKRFKKHNRKKPTSEKEKKSNSNFLLTINSIRDKSPLLFVSTDFRKSNVKPSERVTVFV